MSTTTQSEQSESSALDEIDEDANSAFDELAELDRRSHGQWVKGKCTRADDVSNTFDSHDIEYEFIGFNDMEIVKQFEIPDVTEDSAIKEFLDTLGYSVQNAKMLEGDEFWLHVEKDSIRKELPSKWKLKCDPRSWYHRLQNRLTFTDSHGYSDTYIVVLFPVIAIFSPFFAFDNDITNEGRRLSLGIFTSLIWFVSITLVYFYFVA